MKRLLLLFVAVTALSCSSDDSDPLVNNINLIGEWKQTALKISNEVEEWNTTECTENSYHGIYYVINDNNTYKAWDACEGATGEEMNYPYSLNNNIFITTESTVSRTYAVSQMSGNKIKLVLLSETMNGETTDESNSGYYEIYQKQ